MLMVIGKRALIVRTEPTGLGSSRSTTATANLAHDLRYFPAAGKPEGAGDNPLTPAPVFSVTNLSAGFTLPKTLLGQDGNI